jgi:hypothetical protein
MHHSILDLTSVTLTSFSCILTHSRQTEEVKGGGRRRVESLTQLDVKATSKLDANAPSAPSAPKVTQTKEGDTNERGRG